MPSGAFSGYLDAGFGKHFHAIVLDMFLLGRENFAGVSRECMASLVCVYSAAGSP